MTLGNMSVAFGLSEKVIRIGQLKPTPVRISVDHAGVDLFLQANDIALAEQWIVKDRTVNGTFASISPVGNSRAVGFGYVFTPSRVLTRLVNGRKR